MKTQDVDVVDDSKGKSCTIWGDGKVLSDVDEIKEYKDLLKEVEINNMLIGSISDDGIYSIKKELKRDLMRMQKGVADTSDRYYIAYAQVLDKTFHFSIAIDDLSDKDVIATLYLTESVEDYQYLESVRSFVASVILPNDNLRQRVYKTFNLVDTIPDNNDDKLIQNLLLRMLEILNEASPKTAVELPHDGDKQARAEGSKKGEKSKDKPADKPKEKSDAKPAKKAAPKKKEAKKDGKKGGDKKKANKKADKKPDKKKDDKKKAKKLEDLLGKKYDAFKPESKSTIETFETIEIKNIVEHTGDRPKTQEKPIKISPKVEKNIGSIDDMLMEEILDQGYTEKQPQISSDKQYDVLIEDKIAQPHTQEQVDNEMLQELGLISEQKTITEVSIEIEGI